MFRSPIVILAGNAGSGKDTVGSYLTKKYNAVCVAQADPMKRFVAEVFGFDENQLWGPSAMRNAPDERTVTDKLAISQRFSAYMLRAQDKEVFGEIVPKTANADKAARRLHYWFEQIYHNLENDIPVSPRLVLQTLGGEWGRVVSQNMSADYAAQVCTKLLFGGFSYDRTKGLIKDQAQVGYDYAVITDGRYRNEVVLATMKGATALRIDRVNPDKAAVEQGGVKNHQSERELDGIPPHFFTATIDNSGTLDELYQVVDYVMKGVYPSTRFCAGNTRQFTFIPASA